MLTRRIPTIATVTAGIALAAGASAQCVITKLVHSDRQTADHLGGCLAMSVRPGAGGGPYCVLGMSADNTAAGVNAGSVRCFTRSGASWLESAALSATAADGQANDFFGASVAVRDPMLAVGATGVGDTGAMYVFERVNNTFVQKAKIIPPGSGAGDDVGRSVAIHGSWALVGAPLKDFDTGPNVGIEDLNAGAAYFYQYDPASSSWVLRQTVADALPQIFGSCLEDQFGHAVSMHQSVAVIGVPYGERINWPDNHGYVRILRRNAAGTWMNDASFSYHTAPTVESDDLFGSSVANTSEYIVVGAPGDDATSQELGGGLGAKTNSGCVYFYRYTGSDWASDGRVFAPDAADNARFGAEVAISGDRAIVSAPGAGKAYTFRRSAPGVWSLLSVVEGPSPATDFGSGVAIEGDLAMIGDADESAGGVAGCGAVFAYTLPSGWSDECSGAFEIPAGATSVAGCTTFATVTGPSICGAGPLGNGPDVWLAFTAACTAQVTMDTVESAYDTVLSVHSACPDSASTHTLTCNDDIQVGVNAASRVSFSAVAGTRYLIRVSGFSGSAGNFGLQISYPDMPNDWCASPTPVAAGQTYAFQNCTASTDGPTADGGPSVCADHMIRDVWYSYQSPVPGTLVLNTCGSDFDTLISVYPGAVCPVGGQFNGEIACNDDAASGPCTNQVRTSYLEAPVLAAFPYRIRVGGYDTTDPMGNGLLSVGFIPACRCDFNLSNSLSVQDIFDFLTAYFSGDADINDSGATTVQDIFDFLACYFAGCA